ncbi:hypothetical protein AJ88_12610 [Mesorhizobium amorphae CCBAU 01583]|nr:hypothetical protein AJ88_12610 [Mesorhizobium amorphae CCBAU 01583]
MITTIYTRMEAADDPGIFIHLAARADLLAQAVALGSFHPVAKPLWGIPFAVKDNIDVAGMPTTAACAEYTYWPDQDATVVARLKAAGALVVGKTNLDQFATGLVGVRTPWPIRATPLTRRWCRAALPPVRRWRRRAASSPSRSAPTPPAPGASRPASTTSSG